MRWHLGIHGGSLGSTPEATLSKAKAWGSAARKGGCALKRPSNTSKVLSLRRRYSGREQGRTFALKSVEKGGSDAEGCKVMMDVYEASARSRLKRRKTSYLVPAHPFVMQQGLLGLLPQGPGRDAARLSAQPATKRNAGGGGMRGPRPYARVLSLSFGHFRRRRPMRCRRLVKCFAFPQPGRIAC